MIRNVQLKANKADEVEKIKKRKQRTVTKHKTGTNMGYKANHVNNHFKCG